MFARSSRQYKRMSLSRFSGIEKSLQGSPTAPIFGVQTVSLVTVLAAREDPLTGSQSTLGTSDCQG